MTEVELGLDVLMASRYGKLEQTPGYLPSRKIDSLFEYLSNHLKAPLSILIIGETGSGKSTLVNNLIGEDVAKIGETAQSETMSIQVIECRIRGVNVIVSDTAGLRDSRGTKQDLKVLKALKSSFKAGRYSLVIFCFKMTETRMNQDKIDIFKDYHKIGIPWHRTFIALTFADIGHQTIRELDLSEEAAHQRKLEDWQKKIVSTLQDIDGRIDKAIEERIFPTTSKPSLRLPNNKDWLASMWVKILETANKETVTLCLQLRCNDILPPSYARQQ